MGTLFRIELFAPDAATAQAAFHEAFARVAQLDQTLTDYNPESELSRITRSAVQHPAPVSEELFAVLSTAQHLSEDSGGAFDITVGPLTRLWRAARKAHQPPSPEAIAEAAARCGYRRMHLDAQQHTVMFDNEGMQLDAGAIAKGYAADEALAVITRRGIRSALVAASGDLAFSGAPPGQSGWRIGIADRVLVLANGAVSTSGDSEQHMDYNGVRYSHIVDPRTGMALSHSPLVSISGTRAIETDAASTAVSVLGAVEGTRMATRHPDFHIFLNSSR